MDNNPYQIADVPLDSLLGSQDTTRVSKWQNTGYGFDTRSGSGVVKDINGNQITFGLTSDNTLGIELKDNTGYTTFKLSGNTWYWYDKTTTTNVMQIGKLPDGTYGFAVAVSGANVSDIFS